MQNATTDGSQEWQLVKDPATAPEPKVSLTVSGADPNAAGWRPGPASVALALNEGVQADIEYRLGVGEWQPYSAPVQVSGDGETVLSYRAVVNGVPVENSGGAETIRIDATAPTVALVGGPTGDYTFGHDAAAPTCETADAVSGLASCTVTGGGATVGGHTYTATATDNAGNVSTAELKYTVLPWTVSGFMAPVDMAGAWNTVKGGSTVPFRFELFDGATELTDLSKVKSFSTASVACPGPGAVTDEIETVTTDVTGLVYQDGHFQQNWKTPKKAGSCLQVTMTAQDETKLTANFIIK
ncbi:PxKF domain-containing protein [Arthrobacter sp. ISL-30]|uniref:PxKF domain-containing protein n=1 Tax=Arthrobacter sp. ISL-30 TaxID=2819109 RepID=UPI00203557CA|nr:PxKF domain-containing protein [Arthrobacter sp. ISL-30]